MTFSEVEQVDGKRLGRRPPTNKPAIMFSQILRAVPDHPASADYLTLVGDYGLYGNDRYGDCGPVSVANSYKVVSLVGGAEWSASQEDVFDLYRRSGNPDFDPVSGTDDNG